MTDALGCRFVSIGGEGVAALVDDDAMAKAIASAAADFHEMTHKAVRFANAHSCGETA
jgi:hypothetical protein